MKAFNYANFFRKFVPWAPPFNVYSPPLSKNSFKVPWFQASLSGSIKTNLMKKINQGLCIALTAGSATLLFQSFSSYRIYPQAAESYIVSTVAGTGGTGTKDGSSDKAEISSELGNLTVDAAGNIYFMDFTNLRKISTDGKVSTLFGSNIYDTEGNPKEIGQVLKNGGKGIVMDKSGTIYLTERFGHGIVKVSNEKIAELYAGSSQYSGSDDGPVKTAEFKSPEDMCMDKAGNI